MSDYITRLDASLRHAAAHEYQNGNESAAVPPAGTCAARGRPRRWRIWSRWRRSPLALVAVLALAGGSTAAAVVLLSARSAPLTGTVPGLLARLRYRHPPYSGSRARPCGMVQLSAVLDHREHR